MVIADHKIPVFFRLRDRPGRDRCKEMISIRYHCLLVIMWQHRLSEVVRFYCFMLILCFSHGNGVSLRNWNSRPFLLTCHNRPQSCLRDLYLFFLNVLVCNHRGQIMYGNNSVDIFRIWILKLMLDT